MMLHRIAFLSLLCVLQACGGGGGGGGGNNPPPATADLRVTIAGPATAALGSSFDYTLTVSNSGTLDAASVDVQAAITGTVSVDAISDGGSETGGTISWPTIATLAAGANQTFTVSMSSATAVDISVTASGTTSSMDGNLANNDGSAAGATAATAINNNADVAVTQTFGGNVVPGAAVTLSITVQNDGPDEARDVDVSAALSGDLPIATISDGGMSDGVTVSWPTIASIAAGTNVVYTIAAEGPLVGPVEIRAAASASTPDPTMANNDGSASNALARLLTTFDDIRRLDGEANGDQFGWLMENLGDLDGDGVADFAVTAPTNDEAGPNAGKVYLYSGSSGSLLRSFTGSSGEQFGYGVDAAGDIDGDGVGDVIIGAPFAGNGRAVIYSGDDGAEIRTLTGPAAGEQFGYSVARAGDVNDDGVNDVIVGAPAATGAGAGAGRVYVYSGADGAQLFAIDPAVAGAGLGSAVGGPGDLDGDGFDDLIAGAPNTAGGGRVYVFSGATGTMLYNSIAPDASGAALGNFWIESPGDLNGDGRPDIFAADILNSAVGANTGRAYVYSGVDGSTLHTFTGVAAGEQFGIGRGAPDANGDGVRDIFAAGWLSSEGAPAGGKAYLYSGDDGELLRTFTSTTAGENLGFDAVSIGDVDADGIPDYLISGGISPTSAGYVRVIKGVAIP